jgi:hypothetical protein
LIGFFKSFDLRDGVVRYAVLLCLQILLQPVFGLMEVGGVILAIVSPPLSGFHVVKKEGKELTNA